jgi:hypothetical protein
MMTRRQFLIGSGAAVVGAALVSKARRRRAEAPSDGKSSRPWYRARAAPTTRS